MARGDDTGTRCGRCVMTLLYMVTSLYVLVCVAFSLLARLYLKTYYIAAHLAALSAFVGGFLLVHHAGNMYRILGVSFGVFRVWQVLINLLYLLCCLTLAACYTALLVLSISVNYDYIAALCWGWVNALVMLYLLIASMKLRRRDYGSDLDYSGAMYSVDAPDFEYDSTRKLQMMDFDERTTKVDHKMAAASCSCKRCIVGLFRTLWWILYALFHLLLLIFFALSSYQAAASVHDVVVYRNDSEMYTVQVGFHRPIALNMKCAGQGNETIVFENGLGGELFLAWDFLPSQLSSKYRFCAYDRRGYGWSESFESDYPGMLQKEPQWSRTNVDFFKALVDVANISTPFFYAGHSYGGHHMVYMSMLYPEYIKGLIFIDSSGFSALDTFEALIELLVNFQATGLMRFAVATGLFDFNSAFQEFVPFDLVPDYLKTQFLSSTMSNLFFAAFMRENLVLQSSGFEDVLADTNGTKIYKRALVVDAGNRGYWFPDEKFPLYDSTYYHQVAGSDHFTITQTHEYGDVVANHIDEFIQRVTS